jgi:hypothetical protein
MKNINISITLLLFVFIFIGCSEDNIVDPSNDDLIQNNIVGHWKFNDYRSLTFLADGTFIDSMFIESTQSNLTPQNIVVGKYFIKNSILDFSELRLDYSIFPTIITSPSEFGFVQHYDMYKISFEDNNLKMQAAKIFEKDNSNSTVLKGKWNSYQWVATYITADDPEQNGGKLEESFNFMPDSNICEYSSRYSFETTAKADSNKIYSYSYNNSELVITNKLNGTVQEEEGKLFLYSDYDWVLSK